MRFLGPASKTSLWEIGRGKVKVLGNAGRRRCGFRGGARGFAALSQRRLPHKFTAGAIRYDGGGRLPRELPPR